MKPTLLLSMPMPKAFVATMMRLRSYTKSSWLALRSPAAKPAWYRVAEKPSSFSMSHTSSTLLRDVQYTMPLCPSRLRQMARSMLSFPRVPLGRRTSKCRFGLSKLATTRKGSRKSSASAMSSRTRWVAVAVNAATTGRVGKPSQKPGNAHVTRTEILAPT